MRPAQLAVFLSMLVVACSVFATAPTTFSTAKQPLPIKINGYLMVTLNGDEVIDCKDLTLAIDNMGGLAPECAALPGLKVKFHLVRTDKNAESWRAILRQEPHLELSLAYKGKQLAWSEKKGDEVATVQIERGGLLAGVIAVCVTVGLLLLIVRYRGSGLLRDAGVPQMPTQDRPYSLGRVQMAIWTIVTLASFLYIYLATDSSDSLTPESLALLGISGATAVGAAAIQISKRELDDVQTSLRDELLLGCAGDVKILRQTVSSGENKRNAIATVEAEITHLKAKVGNITSPSDPSNADKTEDKLKEATEKLETLKAEWTELEAGFSEASANLKKYQNRVEPFTTRNFFKDILTDADGAAFHRFQNLIWTVLLAVLYLWTTWAALETPKLGTTLLGLMGISGGVYLGFKFTEVPGQSDKPGK
ncbi:ABC transporter C-terminal domain-containing protein [Caballeronia sp. 15711]|uniref:ABC transporter C-terminal domain-containing protein n=1 Tax=Caballeronia sp. 15711 TaxID=3391029 RepID=UPI0039E70C24